MKKLLTSLLFCCCFFLNAQEIVEDTARIDMVVDAELMEIVEEAAIMEPDTIVYEKNTKISTQRGFDKKLSEIYTGKEFTYIDEVEAREEKSSFDPTFLNLFINFMSNIFPFILGGFIIFIILKAVLGFDLQFWKPSKNHKKLSKKLIFEEDDIYELNLKDLLQNAIVNKEFRLAIRYYYLSTLKQLSNKKLIDYHKDKTNSAYILEIKNEDLKKQFSYLSYVYNYVWYGEFPVDASNFKVVQHKYESFLKNVF